MSASTFTAALFAKARTWTQHKCPSHNGISLNHIKEQNYVICRHINGTRNGHIKWSKSEREKQISYINAYMWNLEKWYRWTYLQSRTRDTDVENQHLDTKGVRGHGIEWEIGIDIYMLCLVAQSCPTLCSMNCSQPGSSVHGDSPGKNTRVGCHALLQGIFPTQGSNPGLPHCRQILYHLSYQGGLCMCVCVFKHHLFFGFPWSPQSTG